MSEQEDESVFQELIHHSDRRKPHGCMLINIILAAIPIIVILFFIDVKMPEEPQDSGEGTVYQKSSAFMYSNTRTLSPLPLKLPSFADPAQIDSFVPKLMVDRSPKLHSTPRVLSSLEKRGSAVLNKEMLLELPPASQGEQQKREDPIKGDMNHATP